MPAFLWRSGKLACTRQSASVTSDKTLHVELPVGFTGTQHCMVASAVTGDGVKWTHWPFWERTLDSVVPHRVYPCTVFLLLVAYSLGIASYVYNSTIGCMLWDT